MRAVVDTCIVIDALQNRLPFFKDAQLIFMLCATGRFDGFISSKAITDIYYLTKRQTHSEKTTREIIAKLCLIFGLFDTTYIDIKNALSSNISDYEDAVMVETSLRSKMDCIITRNIKDYSKASLHVYTPNEFIDLFIKTGDN